jgi:hypothetical protein
MVHSTDATELSELSEEISTKLETFLVNSYSTSAHSEILTGNYDEQQRNL